MRKKIGVLLLAVSVLAASFVCCAQDKATGGSEEAGTAASGESERIGTAASGESGEAGAAASTGRYDDEELNRAVAYGFGEYRTDDPFVTYGEFMKMLDRAVELIDPDKSAGWEQRFPEIRQSGELIDHGNAILAVFSAAETLGGDIFARNCSNKGNGDYSGDWEPDPCWGDVSRFPDGFEESEGRSGGDFRGWACQYVTSRGSVISEKRIFEYPEGDVFIHGDEALPYTEALCAVLRFYESTIVITDRYPAEEDEALLTEVEEKKQAILNSETDVTYTGAAYYVANGGDDANDGMSPENAWATLDRVNRAKYDGTLQTGDAVLLNRGDLWRGWIDCAAGVAYSAYGTGAKPKIYGSSEDGAGGEKWELWYDGDGVKIWKYYHDMSEVGNIVFDDGAGYATRVYSYYNGTEWVVSGEDQRPFDVVENLKHDLTFYSTFELSSEKYQEYVDACGGNVWADLLDDRGALYLRCDAGNPGELYQEIEFHQAPDGMDGYIGLVTPAGDNLIDNLCIKYSVVNGIAIYGSDSAQTDNNNNVVQNCEIGWTGGDQHELNRPAGDVMVCGENIVWKTDNNVFRNNYMYQSACSAFVCEFVDGEWLPETSSAGTVIEGNVVERCQDGFWFWDNDNGEIDSLLGPHVFYQDTVIEDNYVMYMGYGWSAEPKFMYPENVLNTYHQPGESYWAFAIGSDPARVKNMTVRNNVFYLACGSPLIWVNNWGDISGLDFSGNTYVSGDNRKILASENTLQRCLGTEEVINGLAEFLGDEDAKVFPVSVESLLSGGE